MNDGPVVSTSTSRLIVASGNGQQMKCWHRVSLGLFSCISSNAERVCQLISGKSMAGGSELMS
jgi:hypothetical protein